MATEATANWGCVLTRPSRGKSGYFAAIWSTRPAHLRVCRPSSSLYSGTGGNGEHGGFTDVFGLAHLIWRTASRFLVTWNSMSPYRRLLLRKQVLKKYSSANLNV